MQKHNLNLEVICNVTVLLILYKSNLPTADIYFRNSDFRTKINFHEFIFKKVYQKQDVIENAIIIHIYHLCYMCTDYD